MKEEREGDRMGKGKRERRNGKIGEWRGDGEYRRRVHAKMIEKKWESEGD